MEAWAISTSPYGLGLTDEDFWDITLPAWTALYEQYRKHQEAGMLGFQFLATIQARLAGNKDVSFMPGEEEKPLISLDATESYFRSLAEAQARKRIGP